MSGVYKLVKDSLHIPNAEVQLIWHALCSLSLLLIPIYLMNFNTLMGFVAAQITLPIFYFRSFALMHDAVHNAGSKYKCFNHAAGLLGGTFCLLPYWPWKDLHIDHHKWAGNVEKDPVMKIVRDYDSYPESKKGIIRFCWKYWVPWPAMMQNIVFWAECSRRIFKNGTRRDRLLNTLSLLVPASVYSLSFVYLTPMLLVASVSAFVIYLVMVEVINFPHHLSLPQERGDTKLAFKDQHSIARSCHYPKSFARLVLNNFNYHIEHHMFPHLPWFVLTQVREVVKPYLGENYNESEANAWIVENRKHDFGSVVQGTNSRSLDVEKQEKIAA